MYYCLNNIFTFAILVVCYVYVCTMRYCFFASATGASGRAGGLGFSTRNASEWIIMSIAITLSLFVSMPQAPHEAHRCQVRAGNMTPASLTLNPFWDYCHSSLAVLVCGCVRSQFHIHCPWTASVMIRNISCSYIIIFKLSGSTSSAISILTTASLRLLQKTPISYRRRYHSVFVDNIIILVLSTNILV